MSVKCFQAKVVCDSPEKREYLWLTHTLFHDALRALLPHLFKMRRGDYGADLKEIYEAITDNQNSFAKLEPITTPKPWRSKHADTGDTKNHWADLCLAVNREGRILFDRTQPPFGFGSEFWRKVCEMAIQLIHSHDGLLADWRKERAEWLDNKKQWEAANPEYMAAKSTFDAFEVEAGRLRGSRKRWLLYLEFLQKHPELAAWRGGEAKVTPLTPAERKRCRRPGDHFEIFWEKNPQLAELNRLDRDWRRNFARFKRRPTWTNPDPELHPAWFSFKRGSTYKDLDLDRRTINLNVLVGEDVKGRKGKWVTYEFRQDPRLTRLRPLNNRPEGRGKKFTWLYADPVLKKDRPAEVKGIKLVFRNRHPYLLFSVDIADEKSAPLTRPGFDDKRLKRKATPADIPDGTRILSIDFGQRLLAACSVCEFIQGRPQRPDAVFFMNLPGLKFGDIGRHEQTISRRSSRMFRAGPRSRESRHAPRGGTTFREFRRHVLKMKDDRYKKATRLILDAAVRHDAQVILVENLKNYKPDLERSARENRARMRWNVQRIVEFLDKSAHPLGLRLWKVWPHWSSRFCSACGHPGARFAIPRKSAWKRFYERRHGPIRKPVTEPGGQFFICSNPNCPRPTGIINADVNASLNLLRILADDLEKPTGQGKTRLWRGQDYNPKAIAEQCQQRLDKHFRSKADLAQQTPW